MNLNQLALEMWERLGCCEIDASVVSRVLKGKRSFTFEQIEVFCRILKLNSQQINQLKDAYWMDLADKFGCDFQKRYFSAKEVVENAKKDFSMIQKLKASDEPVLTEEFVDLTVNKLDKKIRRSSDESVVRQLLEIKGKVLFQRSYCATMNRKPAVASRENFKTAKEILKIGKLLKNPQIISYGYSAMGADVFYHIKDYASQTKYLFKSANTFTIETEGGEFTTMSPLRDLLIGLSLMGKEDEFEVVKDKVMQVIPLLERNIGLTCQMWEGLARAEFSLANEKQGLKYLQEAWVTNRIMEKNNNKHFLWRKGQLVRTQLIANRKMKFGIDANFRTMAKNTAIELSKRGYYRYSQNINELLSSI